MKKLFLIVLLCLSYTCTLAGRGKNHGYLPISRPTIDEVQRLQDFAQLGTDFVIQKAIFEEDTDDNLPNGKYVLDGIESLEKSYDDGIFYYRYTVQIQSESTSLRLRSTFVITYSFVTGVTNVDSYEYTVLSNDPDGPCNSDLPLYINLSALKDGAGLTSYLNQGMRYVIKDLVERGEIRDREYRAGETFAIKDTGFSYPYGYVFVTTLVNDAGYTRRAEVTVYITDNNNPDDEDACFPPEYILYDN